MNSYALAIIDNILYNEGGYVDNQLDLGGPTNFGITIKQYRSWKNNHNITKEQFRKISKSDAIEFYYEKFFIGPNYNLIANKSKSIAEKIMDMAVNQGPSTASKALQRALNLFNKSHSSNPYYPDLKIDGVIGPSTLNSLQIFLDRRAEDGEHVIIKILNILQGYRYIEITESRIQNEEFIFGWINNRIN